MSRQFFIKDQLFCTRFSMGRDKGFGMEIHCSEQEWNIIKQLDLMIFEDIGYELDMHQFTELVDDAYHVSFNIWQNIFRADAVIEALAKKLEEKETSNEV